MSLSASTHGELYSRIAHLETTIAQKDLIIAQRDATAINSSLQSELNKAVIEIARLADRCRSLETQLQQAEDASNSAKDAEITRLKGLVADYEAHEAKTKEVYDQMVGIIQEDRARYLEMEANYESRIAELERAIAAFRQ